MGSKLEEMCLLPDSIYKHYIINYINDIKLQKYSHVGIATIDYHHKVSIILFGYQHFVTAS